MADPTGTQVMTDARALLNDANGIQYTDAVLLPYLKISWDELAAVLSSHSIPVLKEVSADVDVDESTVVVAGPTDLVTPIKLQEKPQGATDDLFVDMKALSWEGSEYPPTAYINYWAWRGQSFHFAPHTNTQTVRIFYIKDLSVITSEAQTLAVHHCKVVLSKRTAALAARYMGANPTRADSLDKEAEYFMNLVVNREVQTSQGIAVRRRGYRASRRR